jgi:FkbM family methyltransferase
MVVARPLLQYKTAQPSLRALPGFDSLKAKIKTWIKRRVGVPQIEFALERLARIGFTPRLVFDAGAYQGDFARIIRNIWPGAEIASFEVQPAPLRRLQAAFANDGKLKVFPCLLGATAVEKVALNLNETASSILKDQNQNGGLLPSDFFPMRTVDDIVRSEFGGRAPELLKMDVQGYELEILRGAEKSLPAIRAVLLEVNLIDIYKDVPLVGEVSEWLRQRGWVLYDICGFTRRPLDQALWQADMIFIPENSPLRASKKWD